MDVRELVLDGNAAAGMLADVFAWESTAARSVCEHCGADHAVGELVVYAQAPGLVIRCRGCGGVQLRVVRAGTRVLVDLRGCRSLEFRTAE